MNGCGLVTVIGSGPVGSGVKLFIETACFALRFARDPAIIINIVIVLSDIAAFCKHYANTSTYLKIRST